jgi:hypothetical protein
MRNALAAKLSFNYLWSNPEADNDTLVAAALSRPAFRDLLAIAMEVGPEALETAWERLEKAEAWPGKGAREISRRYVNIILEANRELFREHAETPRNHPTFA